MNSYFDFNAPTLARLDPLPFFTRNEATERHLDDRQLTLERSHCLSVHLFCRKLEKRVEEFNSNHFFRSQVVNFLESGEDQFIYELQKQWPTDEYLKRLTKHLHHIKELLVIVHIHPGYTRLNHLINNLKLSLKEVDYDLSRLSISQPFWVIATASYGKILINQQHTIILVDKIELLAQETFAPGSILFITVPISNDNIESLFVRHHPLIIAYRSKSDMIQIDEPINSLHKSAFAIRCAAANIMKKRLMSTEAEQLMPVIIEEMDALELLFEEYAKSLRYHRGQNHKIRYIYEKIKRLQLKVMHLHFEHRWDVRKLGVDLERLADHFNNLDQKYAAIIHLPQTIMQGIHNITTNSNLYRVNNNLLFNENNLTAALLTWLKSSLPHPSFSVLQEDPIANGRSDISIHTGRQRISVIESKLVQAHAKSSDIQSKIKEGVFQLYTKYSDAVAQSLTIPPEMFFVLFCFNPNFRGIRDNIAVALEELTGEYSRLTLTRLTDPSNTCFRFRLRESGGQFADKIVDINLVIAALRTQDNLDDKHGKFRR
ncbi:hypothetical protein H5A34_13255 [Pectobacterium brasiliense]|uniref:hypothetical protein n=1 Tax=Pectobacterium brasiliense TaxID=180957 RepID=UPI0019695289|nr:hypothetical protein [Pectobacterium brasiliense]MBN3069181.1 hypothetical protein [Pectobacterium brasiliense]MBN3247111.1 hypothetical protein [Pectobacterium brasiliense]